MTYSFQLVVNTDEEMGTVLSVLLGGLITLGKQKKELEKQSEELINRLTAARSAVPTETRIESVKSVADAKRVMKEEGYVFYKYKKPAAEVFRQRRRRRTKKEMEEIKNKE